MRSDIDRHGIAQLARDPGVQKQVEGFARVAYMIARASAPEDSGEYKRRMFVRRGRTKTVATAYFGSQSYKGWWVEFGSINNRAHGTLVTAAREAGMKVRFIAKPGGVPR